jgi:hypothetical protein
VGGRAPTRHKTYAPDCCAVASKMTMNYPGHVYVLHCRFTAGIGLAEAVNYVALLKLQPLDNVSCNMISAELQGGGTSLHFALLQLHRAD